MTNPDDSGPSRLSWLASVAAEICSDARLLLTADIEDLVAITFAGLLDTPAAEPMTRNHLLHRCRENLLIWAWEQGALGEQLPRTTTVQSPPQPSRNP